MNFDDNVEYMSLDEKVGQMIVAHCFGRFDGVRSTYFQSLADLVSRYHVGAFKIYYGSSFESALLVHHLERLSKYPLLIASDLERGLGSQMTDAVELPSAMAIAAGDDARFAYMAGKMMAVQARAIGINFIFAPLADTCSGQYNYFGTRSFGEKPERVAQFVSELIKGIQQNGALAAAKYFPGHGCQVFDQTGLKSASNIPVVFSSREAIEQNDLVPFHAAIENGVSAIMTSHAAFPAFNSSINSATSNFVPATFSRYLTTDLLRQELGFQGVIITDALNLPIVSSQFPIPEAAYQALVAGADLLTVLGGANEIAETVNRIRRAVITDEISEERINESVHRIMMLKSRINKYQASELFSLPEKLRGDEAFNLAQEIADRSVTVLCNKSKMLPLPGGLMEKALAILVYESDPKMNKRAEGIHSDLKQETIAQSVDLVAVTPSSTDIEIKRLCFRAREYDLVICALTEQHSARHIGVEVVRRIELEGVEPIVVGFAPPYDLRDLTNCRTLICAYQWSETSRRAILKAILGHMNITGKLPVSIDTLVSAGFGIDVPAAHPHS